MLILTLLVGSLTAKIAEAAIIEFKKYPPANQVQNVVVSGNVVDKLSYATSATVGFQNDSVSQLRLSADAASAPIYFKHSGYVMQGNTQVKENTISFAELASLTPEGAYVASSFIGTGQWVPQHKITVFKQQRGKNLNFEDIDFAVNVTINGDTTLMPVQFSYSNSFHILPNEWLGATVLLQRVPKRIDTSQNQLYDDVNRVILSMHALKLQHWQNATLLKIGCEPENSHELQRFCTVVFLVFTLCALIGISVDTTASMQSYKSAKTCRSFLTLETAMITDFATGAVAVALLSIYDDGHLIDARIFGVENSNEQHTTLAMYVFGSVTLTVVMFTAAARMDFIQKKILRRQTEEQSPVDVAAWVLTRALTECSILIAITASIPPNIGLEYAFVTMFAAAMAVPIIMGRDVHYVYSVAVAKTNPQNNVQVVSIVSLCLCGIAALLSGLWITSNSFLRVVLARSESFPTETPFFLEFTSAVCVAIIACAAAARGPIVKGVSPIDEVTTNGKEQHVL